MPPGEEESGNRTAEREEQLRTAVRAALRQGDYAHAAALANDALAEFVTEGEQAGQATALYVLGTVRQATDPAAAFEAYKASLELREGLGDFQGMAKALDGMGAACARQADYTAALRYMHRGLALAREIGDRKTEAGSLFSISGVHKDLGDPASAVEMLHQCLLQNEAAGDTYMVALTQASLAINYNVLENPTEAIRWAERCLPTLEAQGSRYNVAHLVGVMGMAYASLKQLETALTHFRRAIEIMESLGAVAMAAYLLASSSDALIPLGRYEEARETLERSIRLNGKEGQPLYYCEALRRLGVLYTRPEFAEHSDATALPLLLEARRIAEGSDMPMLLGPVYTALTDLYERQGDLKEALACHRLLHATEKRVFNETSDRRMQSLEVRFELQHAQQEAELARRDAEIAHIRSVELAEALEEAERLRALADERARTDALTGVYNRRYLDEQLEAEWERASSYGRPLSVALVDIDHFKQINDRFGHSVGDAALRRTAQILQEVCRASDRIARYGGEEFALMLPETSSRTARALCELIRQRIEAEDWQRLVPGLHLTVSIGLRSMGGVNSAKHGGPASLFNAADQSLYLAKTGGRNRVVG